MVDVSLGILHTRTNVSKSQAFESAGLAQSLIFMLALRLRGGKMRGASHVLVGKEIRLGDFLCGNTIGAFIRQSKTST